MGKVDPHRLALIDMRPEAIEGNEETAEYTDQAKGRRDSYVPQRVIAPLCKAGGETRDGTDGKEPQMEVPGQV